MARDPRIDIYIARQADFARPVLDHLREAVHSAGLEIEEAIKWGMPFFLYKSRQLAMMAGFKAHAAFRLWDGSAAVGTADREAMGQFGRIGAIADLPPVEELHTLLRKAAALIDGGVKRPRPAPKPSLEPPADLLAALDSEARTHFGAFSPSARREYVEWVTDAKRPETRAKRIAQAAEWIAEGKKRNWKYEGC